MTQRYEETPMPLFDDGYTFELSEEVTRIPVRYRNRLGVEIAADLYRRKDLDESVAHPALVIGPPHGGVKEQGPGVYAQEMAKRGFVAIGFDPSYNGESGGEPGTSPRRSCSPRTSAPVSTSSAPSPTSTAPASVPSASVAAVASRSAPRRSTPAFEPSPPQRCTTSAASTATAGRTA
jgi:hypothetical protein